MAKKKILEKKADVEAEKADAAPIVDDKPAKKTKTAKASKKSSKAKAEAATETDAPTEDIDAFDLDNVPAASSTEPSAVEQEIAGEEPAADEEIKEERIYTVPLAKIGFSKGPNWNRAKKAMKTLREFGARHMKPEGDIFVSQELNERVWEYGIKNPPRKLRVRFTKSVDGIVRAYLA